MTLLSVVLNVYFIFIFFTSSFALFEAINGGFKAINDEIVLSPRNIYENEDLNVIGSYLKSILIILVCPMLVVLKLLYWLTHTELL